MFYMDDKENETQPESKGANKLVVEPSSHKPRRSVLKEFDPFAPDSPCLPKSRINERTQDIKAIEEDEIFEDAETSLTSYVCPRNKNIDNSPEKAPMKTAHRDSILIPGLNDNRPEERNPNDTVDMSYVEAVENLSHEQGVLSLDKSSSEDDIEFNSKNKNPEILGTNKLLNVTGDINIKNGLSQDNIMVDSLEHTFDVSEPLDSNIENIISSGILNKTGPIEVKENSTSDIRSNSEESNKTVPIEASQQHNEHVMVDSLELPGPQESTPVLENTFEKIQENIIDSLEIVKSQENLEDSITEEIPLTLKGEYVEGNAQNETVVIENDNCNCESNVNLENPSRALSDKTDASIENQKPLEIKTFEAVSTTTDDSNSNIDLHKSFETPLSNAVEFKGDQVQSERINTLNGNVDLNKTFENTPSTVELHRTFDSSSLTAVEVRPSIGDDIPLVEKDATIQNEILEETIDLDGNKPRVQENLSPMVKLDEEYLQMGELGQKEACKCDTNVEKTLNIPPSGSMVENIVITSETDNTASEVSKKMVENAVEQELTHSELKTSAQSNDYNIVEDHSVPLKELISIDASVQDDVRSENIEQTASEISPVPSSNSEEVNSTFITDEDVAESSRVMEALAESLNRTIDVEESAIADDINNSPNSKNTSADLINDRTIENIMEGEHVAEDGNIMKLDDKLEEHRQNKTLERKETEEFEDLERQYDEKAQNPDKCAKEAIDSLEAVISKFSEEKVDAVVEQEYSRVFLRQDTREFEALERECDEGAPSDCHVQKENVKFVPKMNVVIKQEDLNDEWQEAREIDKENVMLKSKVVESANEHKTVISETANDEVCHVQKENVKFVPKMNVVIKQEDLNDEWQEAREIDKENVMLKSKVVENANEHKTVISETANDEVVKDLPTYLTDLPLDSDEGPVIVRVSGNVCSATSSVKIDTKSSIEEPFSGIELKHDIINDVQQEFANHVVPDPTEVSINGFKDRTYKKTDKQMEEVPNSTVIKNDPVPRTSDSITKPINRPECRPSTRSLRNKTPVIAKPGTTNDASKEIAKENGDYNTNLTPNELAAKEMNEYNTKSEELKSEMKRLQTELDSLRTENKQKDKYILTCALDIEAERDNVIKLKKLLKEYDQTIEIQNGHLKGLKEEEARSAVSFTSLEMAFADVFKKYEKAKSVIEQYTKNEEILKRNIQCTENELTKLENKCSATKEQYSVILKQTENLIAQEKEKNRQELAKLHAKVKRLEIKSSSLETALNQKTEECQALAALCDDITGRPM